MQTSKQLPPTWLKIKANIKAGDKGFDFGPGDNVSTPSWLKVKTRIKSGGIEPPKSGDGPGEPDGQSAALSRLSARTSNL